METIIKNGYFIGLFDSKRIRGYEREAKTKSRRGINLGLLSSSNTKTLHFRSKYAIPVHHWPQRQLERIRLNNKKGAEKRPFINLSPELQKSIRAEHGIPKSKNNCTESHLINYATILLNLCKNI